MACKAVLWFFGPHTKGRNGQTGSSPSDSLVVPSASFGCPPRVAAFVYSSGADKVRWPSVLLHLHALYMGPVVLIRIRTRKIPPCRVSVSQFQP